MAGNVKLFQQAMDLGHTSAWDQDWSKAIAAYARAIQEIPEDTTALNSLGFALLQVKKYPESLKVYTRAHQIDPNDPIPLEKSGDVLERLGRLKEAAQQYIAVADIYLGQHDIDKAIGNWERATLLTAGLLTIHFRLAQAYERIGKKRSAVLQYLILAFNFQRASDKTKALQAIERALRLEPGNPQVLNAKRAIESGELMPVPKDEEPKKSTTGQLSIKKHDDIGDSNPEGPLGEATELALALLAELVLSEDLNAATTQTIQGIELQRLGENESAISIFLRAEAGGIRFPALSMCLGALYLKQEQWQDAQKYLDRVKGEKDFAAGVAHGLGRVFMGLKRPREAAEQLLKALRLADTGLAMHPDEASQLSAVYDILLRRTKSMQDKDLLLMDEQFSRWLTGPDWKVRIPQTRQALNERLRTGDAEQIEYYVTRIEIVESVTRIDRYIKQHLLTLAMDEAYRAIEIEPLSLPVHQRVAQILMEDGRTQEAILKYNAVANSFLARDDMGSAASILNEVIHIAPTDIGLRTSLIELLERQERWPEVLEEYIGLGNAHSQLAELEQARVTYQEAMRLAQRLNVPPEKRTEILHRMADIDLSRLDLRQAQRTYEQIRTLLPNDERARRSLVDINYRLNNPVEAVKEMDGLLRIYAQSKRGDQIISTLEQFVANRPSDMALRSRLAAVYRQINRRPDAIAQLDALGELQLEAGLYQDACATIKLIIAMQPADTEQYRNLLTQLGC